MTDIVVIMSVYASDDLDHLNAAVESILNQTILADLMIYRDGPCHSELNDFLDILAKQENVTVYLAERNNGLASALNFLIEEIMAQDSYQYIARMDADDISRPNRLETQISFLKENLNIDVLGSACHEFGTDFAMPKKLPPQNHSALIDYAITRCPFIHPTVVFRRRVFEHGHRYKEDTSLTEDMALWFDLLLAGCQFANLPQILLDYRLSQSTIDRRRGVSKAFSETAIRLKFMVALRKISFVHIILILARIPMHLMPNSLLRLLYKLRGKESS